MKELETLKQKSQNLLIEMTTVKMKMEKLLCEADALEYCTKMLEKDRIDKQILQIEFNQ